MLPLPSFELLRPRSVEEASSLLAEDTPARLIAGGTDLLPSMKYGLFSEQRLISTRWIEELQGIQQLEDGSLRIGASVTLRELQRHPVIQGAYPSFAAACRTVATPTLQAMATLGGNLMLDTRCVWYNQSTFWREALGGCLKCEGDICHVAPRGKGCYAAHSADTVPTLQLLDAEAELVSQRGRRRVPLTELYDTDGRTWIRKDADEILSAVLLPPAPQAQLSHRKLRARGAIDYPLLLTAARLDRSADGQVTGGRVVISGLGPKPIEIEGIREPILEGDWEEAARLAWKQSFPLSTHVWSSNWRKRMVRVEVRRALQDCA